MMAGVGSPVLAESPGLPTGQDERFRASMMAWTVDPHLPSRPVPPVPPRRAGAIVPLVSSPFGYRRDPINGRAAMHSGIDIPGPIGTPVRASAAGTVRFAGVAGGYGRMIEIDHGGGMVTRYGHLSRELVSPGERVAQGETIGLMGSTGRSTGSHLHFEVRMNGAPMPPSGYFHVDAAIPPRAVEQMSPAPHISDYAHRRAAAVKAGDAEP